MTEEEEETGARRWLVDITRWRPSPAQFDAATALLPPHERPAIATFVKDDDRKRALVSRLLQYSLVHQVLGIPFHQITIRRTDEGKPYLGNYVGVASEPFCLVGLDIVTISKPQGETVADFINNFSSYLTDHEWNCIARAGSPDQVLTELYRYWCLKEAYVKAIGAGVGFGLHRLEFRHEDWTHISVCIDGQESMRWKFWIFKLDEMHLASIAKGHPDDAVNSYKKTLSTKTTEEENLHDTPEIPEEDFLLSTVEQIVRLHNQPSFLKSVVA